ncbi:hypothetical protein [Lentzea sp. NPDC004782]|uniref:hypothetical protein n=1 Tax=Lentzea sp. NPDC004782 TaxID=3154458 RepID=UPI0033A0CBBD
MRTEDGIDLFSTPVVLDPEPGPEEGTAEGTRPRGLTEGGWVRTTGWLQVGEHPVSSIHVAALVGLLWALVAAAVLVGAHPVAAGVLVLVVPVLCGGFWWLLVTRLRPASAARNVGVKRADELVPGDLVRLYGSIGPVAQVADVTSGVEFHGGLRQSWPGDRLVHVAELLS